MARRSSNTNEYTYKWIADTYGDNDLPILKITKSSFGSFQWCPKKYQFSYIERLPQDTTEAMYKGTIVHNAREAFFDDFDIVKAEDMSHSELINYCLSLHPIDDYTEMYETMAIFEANRFLEAKEEDKIANFIPVVNEVMLDAKITVGQNDNPKFPLKRDYTVHLQGIIDRMFYEDGSYIPMELKTGLWKEYKKTMMRKEMAFYKLLCENATDELLEKAGLSKDIPITHWAWYYPASNYLYTEKMKPSSVTSVKKGIAQLIYAYEHGVFPTKYFARTCSSCSFFGICDAANTESWL
jgi:CRISPR/Cas system-associated exonuclease Cas4 (RecB family)|tara:strand:- start:1114 stop:2001 length:888 start_codon:yes stop_codon:yes gene_type:complete